MAIGHKVRPAKAHHRQGQDQVQQMLTVKVDRFRAKFARQLAVSNHRSGKGNCPNKRADKQLDLLHGGVFDPCVENRRDGNQHRRQPHQRVHGCNQFGHMGHFDGFGFEGPNRRPCHHRTNNQ